MPRGIKGFRWIKTGSNVWQLESEPRLFHGCVCRYPTHVTWYVNSFTHGEAKNVWAAKDEVERRVIWPPHG